MYLILADEETAMRAVDRLQRKLTIPFCYEFWGTLREHVASNNDEEKLDRSVFLQVVVN